MSSGPVTMLSCQNCEYHYVQRETRCYCKEPSVMETHIWEQKHPLAYNLGTGVYKTPKEIGLWGNETPDWCPLLPKDEKP